MKQSRTLILMCGIIFCACTALIGWLVLSHKRQATRQVPDSLNVSTLWAAENHERQRIEEKREELDRQGITGEERKIQLQSEKQAAALELKQTLEKSGVRHVTVLVRP